MTKDKFETCVIDVKAPPFIPPYPDELISLGDVKRGMVSNISHLDTHAPYIVIQRPCLPMGLRKLIDAGMGLPTLASEIAMNKHT